MEKGWSFISWGLWRLRIRIHTQRDGCLTIDIHLSDNVSKKLRCFIIGTIAHTETAVWVDTESNVWLWNVPNPTTFWLKAVKHTLVMVMKSGDVLRPDDELEFFEKYDDVKAVWDVIELSPEAIYRH
jgi:hypothetical protein